MKKLTLLFCLLVLTLGSYSQNLNINPENDDTHFASCSAEEIKLTNIVNNKVTYEMLNNPIHKPNVIFEFSPNKKSMWAFHVAIEKRPWIRSICKIDLQTKAVSLIQQNITFEESQALGDLTMVNEGYSNTTDLFLKVRKNADFSANFIFYSINFATKNISHFTTTKDMGTASISLSELICPNFINEIFLKDMQDKTYCRGCVCRGPRYLVKAQYFMIANRTGQISIYDLKTKKLARDIDLSMPKNVPFSTYVNSKFTLTATEVTYALVGRDWSYNATYNLLTNVKEKEEYLAPDVFPLKALINTADTLWFYHGSAKIKEVRLPDFPEWDGFQQWKMEFLRIKHVRDTAIANNINKNNVLFTFSKETDKRIKNAPKNAVPLLIIHHLKNWDSKYSKKTIKANFGKDYKNGIGHKWLTDMKNHIMSQNDSLMIHNSQMLNLTEQGSSILVYSTRSMNSEMLFEFPKAKIISFVPGKKDQLIVTYKNGTTETYSITTKELLSKKVVSDF